MIACFPASTTFMFFVRGEALQPPLIINSIRSILKRGILRPGNRIFRDLERFDLKRTGTVFKFDLPCGNSTPKDVRQICAVQPNAWAHIPVFGKSVTNLSPTIMSGGEIVEFLE